MLINLKSLINPEKNAEWLIFNGSTRKIDNYYIVKGKGKVVPVL
jgi:hypothetical protein